MDDKQREMAEQVEEYVRNNLKRETTILERLRISIDDQKDLVEIAIAATSDSGNKALSSFLAKKFEAILQHK